MKTGRMVAGRDREKDKASELQLQRMETVWKPVVLNGDQTEILRLDSKHLHLLEPLFKGGSTCL